MKKILFSLIFILATITTFAQQNGGDISNIKLKNSAGTKDDVWRTGHSQNTYDTAVAVWLSPLKLKTDSIYTVLNSGIRTILDSTTQRSTVKISGTVPVSGSFWQDVQPISGTVTTTPPSNASTNVAQINGVTPLMGNGVTGTGSQRVTIASDNSAVPILAATLPLPSGASTSAKQPALGTAGTPSSDVITIQGTSGMRAVVVDATATTQPVSIATSPKSVIYDSTVTATAMTITNLSALASSATAGWQSAKVSNLTAMASDYKITVRVSMANTAPANDKSIYVYAVPWGTTDGGTTWYSSTGGTTTSPSGSEGTYTIVSAAPTNFRLLGVLNYQTADMNPCDNFLLSNAFGSVIPDAWSLVIINYSGAALETTSGANNLVYYSPVYKTQR